MINYDLKDQELLDLQVLHQKLHKKREAYRVKSVILLGTGWTPSKVAEVLLIDRTTVRYYFQDYKKGGVNRLLETHYSRHRGNLSSKQEHALDVYLQAHLHITAKSIVRYIEKRWGIYYSESGMTDLLHRLGYVYKKPKLVPGKRMLKPNWNFLLSMKSSKKPRRKPIKFSLWMPYIHSVILSWEVAGLNKERTFR